MRRSREKDGNRTSVATKRFEIKKRNVFVQKEKRDQKADLKDLPKDARVGDRKVETYAAERKKRESRCSREELISSSRKWARNAGEMDNVHMKIRISVWTHFSGGLRQEVQAWVHQKLCNELQKEATTDDFNYVRKLEEGRERVKSRICSLVLGCGVPGMLKLLVRWCWFIPENLIR
ncbi:hypothetical protein L596_027834 [Steinernema carpocapsae]|uniref:Uncharacterized protein n=1 Tax=Steinernema carpocapsae TaxID=34508 RepID=A0A4U5LWN2_STECR|nr:hypothetical protein L596_027834 [Steinernema carpocapsae]